VGEIVLKLLLVLKVQRGDRFELENRLLSAGLVDNQVRATRPYAPAFVHELYLHLLLHTKAAPLELQLEGALVGRLEVVRPKVAIDLAA